MSTDPSSTTVAVIGLGNMGGPMAGNLIKAGFRVVGYDPMAPAVEEAAKRGVETVESGAAAASQASVVITMLPSGKHVIDAYSGDQGLLALAPTGSLFIDCSTIAVEDARTAAELAVAAGHRALDAPVSGGVVGAEAGTLTLMVGGAAADLESAGPVLEAVSGRYVHCGDAGAGQAAKICNNMILGISMIAVSEAFVLGERLGLTHQALFDVASTASGQCWALTTNCPVPGPVPTSPANRDYQPGFAVQLMSKDLNLAMQAAQASGTDTRLGEHATSIYNDFLAGSGVGFDFSAIINEIRERSASDS
jgi:3-hydroxyisobutyrate dehydrogenase